MRFLDRNSRAERVLVYARELSRDDRAADFQATIASRTHGDSPARLFASFTGAEDGGDVHVTARYALHSRATQRCSGRRSKISEKMSEEWSDTREFEYM